VAEKSQSIYVVIPTYNEVDNIAALINALLEVDRNITVIVVDDNSPDGTGIAVDELGRKNIQIKCIHRQGKGGRGAACIEGFKMALAEGAQLIFEMDADFSHDPSEIPLFLEKIKNYDMVLGSRYTRGGKAINWSPLRRVFSHFANTIARFFLQIPITDYTNGYRCYRHRTFDFIDFDAIDAKGYIVLSEIAVQIHRKGLAIGEIPTRFVNRVRGESNLNLNEVIGALTSVFRLWLTYHSVKRPFTPPPGTARSKIRVRG
jgi:dolichol-phosphate mannosyltransferase